MNYQNPYMSYSQYPQAYQQMIPTQMSGTSNNGINWVSGESGAKSWIVGRGETVLLMDSEAQCFYIKSADASGMPLPLRVFDYTERNPANLPSNQAVNASGDNLITRDELDAIWGKIRALEQGMSKSSSAKKKEVIENE